MLFNSIEYLLFFPIVVLLYFLIPNNKVRIFFLLIASYFFYMCWNPIYLTLILASTVIDYLVSRGISKTDNDRRKKILLFISVLSNMGILFYFKYYNFLAENLQAFINTFNDNLLVPEHSFLLPVGISFYTFQTLGYTIDVYKGRQAAEKDFSLFALYVSFFPQLVAGPIERSSNLLPQFLKKQEINYQRFYFLCVSIVL